MFMGLSESVTAPRGAATPTGGARRTRAPARTTEEEAWAWSAPSSFPCPLCPGEAHLLHPFLSLCLPAGRRETAGRVFCLPRRRHSVHGPWRWLRPSLGSLNSWLTHASSLENIFTSSSFFSQYLHLAAKARRVEIHASGLGGPRADTPLIADAGTPLPGLPSTECTWYLPPWQRLPPPTPSFSPFLAGLRL